TSSLIERKSISKCDTDLHNLVINKK
ncbi:hypothetical protein Tsp_07665, partial [Trichinella spiralis]